MKSHSYLSIEGGVILCTFGIIFIILMLHIAGISASTIEWIIGSIIVFSGVVFAYIAMHKQSVAGEELKEYYETRERYIRVLSPIYGKDISELILSASLDEINSYCKARYSLENLFPQIDDEFTETIHICVYSKLKDKFTFFDIANDYRYRLLGEGCDHYLLKLVLLSPTLSIDNHKFIADAIADVSKEFAPSKALLKAIEPQISDLVKRMPNEFIKKVIMDFSSPLVEFGSKMWFYMHLFPNTEYCRSYFLKYALEYKDARKRLLEYLVLYGQEQYEDFILENMTFMSKILLISAQEGLIKTRVYHELNIA